MDGWNALLLLSQVCSAALLVRSLATATGHLEYKGSQEKKREKKALD